jgi:hypothetical protein
MDFDLAPVARTNAAPRSRPWPRSSPTPAHRERCTERSELMGCACQDKKKFEVVVKTDGRERIVFSSQYKSTADTVSKRYPDSLVREYNPKAKSSTPPAAK